MLFKHQFASRYDQFQSLREEISPNHQRPVQSAFFGVSCHREGGFLLPLNYEFCEQFFLLYLPIQRQFPCTSLLDVVVAALLLVARVSYQLPPTVAQLPPTPLPPNDQQPFTCWSSFYWIDFKAPLEEIRWLDTLENFIRFSSRAANLSWLVTCNQATMFH